MIRRPSKSVIAQLVAVFHEYTVTEAHDSNNGLSFIAIKGDEKSFIKIVDKRQAFTEGLEDIETKIKGIMCDNLIKLKSYGDLDDGYQYLEFEQIDGQDLTEIDKPLTEEKVLQLIRNVSTAISALWSEGIVHRDIKPGNIMYDSANDRFVLVDLGIGYFTQDAQRDKTKLRPGIGSRFYSAPEQFWANSNQPYNITFATDVFSLGAVAYEMLAGTAPFIPPADSKIKNYEDAVTGGVVPVPLHHFRIGPILSGMIMKMIETFPTDRFLSVDDLLASSGIEIPEQQTDVVVAFHVPKDGKEKLVEYLLDEDYTNPTAVILNPTTKDDWAEKIADTGVEILFDPQTYKVQKNDSASNVLTKLGLPNSPSYNFLNIYQLKDTMIDAVIKTPINNYSSKVILPYFDLEAAGGNYVTMQRDMWGDVGTIKSRHAELEHKEIFGGVLIPKSSIINSGARSKLLSQLIGKYDLDGIYLILEGLAPSIATIADENYLEGVKIIIRTFEKYYGKVIVSKTDVSALPFMTNGMFATGWSKSSRHLLLDARGRRGDYKMKWFIKPLFTFVEEQSNIETLVDYGFKNLLECGEPCFEENEHTDPGYDPDEEMEQRHYYHSIIDIVTMAGSKSVTEYKEYYTDIISSADVTGNEVRTATSGLIDNKIVPDYERFVALVSN